MRGVRAAPLLLPAVVAFGALSAGAGPVDDAADRGLAFLARSWQGDAYDDAYLAFVYPDEELECPLPDCRLTYRLLDAYINLAFLDQDGYAGTVEVVLMQAGLEAAAMTAAIRGRAPGSKGFRLYSKWIVIKRSYCMLLTVHCVRQQGGLAAQTLSGTQSARAIEQEAIQCCLKFLVDHVLEQQAWLP